MNSVSRSGSPRCSSSPAGTVGQCSRKSSASSRASTCHTRSVVNAIPLTYLNKRVQAGYRPHAYENCLVDGERNFSFINELRSTSPVEGKKLEKVTSHKQKPITKKTVSYKPPQETHAERTRQWQKSLRPLAPVTKEKPAWR